MKFPTATTSRNNTQSYKSYNYDVDRKFAIPNVDSRDDYFSKKNSH